MPCCTGPRCRETARQHQGDQQQGDCGHRRRRMTCGARDHWRPGTSVGERYKKHVEVRAIAQGKALSIRIGDCEITESVNSDRPFGKLSPNDCEICMHACVCMCLFMCGCHVLRVVMC